MANLQLLNELCNLTGNTKLIFKVVVKTSNKFISVASSSETNVRIWIKWKKDIKKSISINRIKI